MAWQDFWPLAVRVIGEWTGGMSRSAFVGDQVLLDVSFDAAQCQLRRLAADGVLLAAGKYAYGVGITGLVEAAGPAATLPRLSGMEPGVLLERGGCARLWLRWQAIGPDGSLFPALDAGLTLTSAGQQTTVLAVAGVYRLPGPVGSGMDPAVVRCFAAVTIRSFIARLACALMHPSGSAIPAGRTRPERPTP